MQIQSKPQSEIIELIKAFDYIDIGKAEEYLTYTLSKSYDITQRELEVKRNIDRLLKQRFAFNKDERLCINPTLEHSFLNDRIFNWYLQKVKERGEYIQIDKARYPLDFVMNLDGETVDILGYDNITGYQKLSYLSKMYHKFMTKVIVLSFGELEMPKDISSVDFNYEILKLNAEGTKYE